MREQTTVPSHYTYIPAVAIMRATLKYSWNKIPVATLAQPDHICGEARRIGYTGKQDSDLAVYRLKIKPERGRSAVTLPGLYIIDGGVFVDYDQWQQEK
ncbi:MAG TPA: hypothetical protein VFB12_21320 [Ktedonobacteraceae bacterium]|nr:hypothetical protein [Ktedonobacteraceae bacterium]